MNVAEQLQLQSEVAQLPLDDLRALEARLEWLTTGRADQMPPPDKDDDGNLRDDWFFWLMMAGRGAGKTRAGAEDTWWWGHVHPNQRIAIVAPTNNDCRKVCFEGESGLLAKCPPHLVSNYNRGELTLTLTSGTILQGFSAEEPNRLRGPQHGRAWCDELAAWQYLDETLDNLLMGLRLGTDPKIVATSTPRPLKRLKEIVNDPTTWVDSVSTYANMANLPAIFIKKIISRYEGSRLGRQELHAEILTDNPGSLWQLTRIDELRVKGRVRKGVLELLAADGSVERRIALRRIVVAVDPSTTSKEGSDETGILVVALGEDGRGYVLADVSVQGATPAEWGRAAVEAYDDWSADRVIVETNQGGEMAVQTIVTAAAAMRTEGVRDHDFVPVTDVWASRGKVTRAEPVSALYEQGRISHVGSLPKLEDQMCEFTSDFDRKKMGYSPDRVDALVWGFTHLMLDADAGTNVQDFYRQEANKHAEAVAAARAGRRVGEGKVWLVPPEGISSATGMMGNLYTIDPETGMMEVFASDAEALRRAGYTEPEQEAA